MFVMMLQFAPLSFAEGLPTNTKTATVFIGLYDRDGHFTGWGSGFFVDEGIVITNKHVIEGARYYRIFATTSDGKVDMNCYKDLTKGDIRVNLEDDVAYIRVYLSCAHGIAEFSDTDPLLGAPLSVVGYPDRGSVSASLSLSTTTGSVTGTTSGPWLKTDAYVHFGNSGGPLTHNDAVIGVAVAKGVDQAGNFITGLFIPVSVIIKGLEYANDSSFGYVPRIRKSTSVSSVAPSTAPSDPFNPQRSGNATNAQCVRSLGSGGEATGHGGCRCRSSYHKDAAGKACLPGAETQKTVRTSRTPVKDPALSKRQKQRVKEAAKQVKIYVKKRGI
jgi:hypothetical protein